MGMWGLENVGNPEKGYWQDTLIKKQYKTDLGRQTIVNVADVGTMGLASYIPGYEPAAQRMRGADYYEKGKEWVPYR